MIILQSSVSGIQWNIARNIVSRLPQNMSLTGNEVVPNIAKVLGIMGQNALGLRSVFFQSMFGCGFIQKCSKTHNFCTVDVQERPETAISVHAFLRRLGRNPKLARLTRIWPGLVGMRVLPLQGCIIASCFFIFFISFISYMFAIFIIFM